jgi:multiple sugar transport system ATP-binding protein
LGVRPEYLRVVPNGRISGTVIHVERLGGDTNLLVKTDADETLTVRLFGQDHTPVGDKITLDFDDANSFLFDADHQRVR